MVDGVVEAAAFQGKKNPSQFKVDSTELLVVLDDIRIYLPSLN